MNVQKSFSEEQNKGCLYLVGTPIGNLEDISHRALRILKEAECIACEDTRQTRKLLTHFQISTRLISYHEHNKHTSGKEIIRLIEQGSDLALVSDAGLPVISDPGNDLVKLAIESNISIIPIPGANAALSAFIISGLETDQFTFCGFLPREKKDKKEKIIELADLAGSIIFYESPHRLINTLNVMYENWGNRQVSIAREITKKYEEVIRGTLEECIRYISEIKVQGEYCIVVQGSTAKKERKDELWWSLMSIKEHVEHYMNLELDKKEAMKKVAGDRMVSKRDIYNHLL
ncbi:16S rRNA (cytidine(1402)-2'-O)-methyltransferase [Chengkuizengella axinellae]|uniref:Ribosomal RNA small subunit methyltransferase I n=1 Tax=Chengkuizengella axinellae TaxID=3064388 RepID=A0ABT9J658_9BACL|nr:16S rRNA (cytidine(1402)-2'-O)-methyltransferase [Chengkuizengella sp. 2205SS18-9]MDP5276932.1 16S rRNA (cytidine(1402)-2'-O)-methyltransferase [Chengkuizengella sp. 2205SS18-9]